MRYGELTVVGRNAVLEAYRSGKTIDRLFILDGCQDGPIKSITREAKKQDTIIQFVSKERLSQLAQNRNHQGVVAFAAAYEYVEVSTILEKAKENKIYIRESKRGCQGSKSIEERNAKIIEL